MGLVSSGEETGETLLLSGLSVSSGRREKPGREQNWLHPDPGPEPLEP